MIPMPIYKVPGKKKNGLQQYRVRVSCTDAFGNSKQIERTAYGYDSAKDIEQELIAASKAAQHKPDITVRELFEEYKKVRSYELRETTVSKSVSILNNHVLPFYEDVRIDRININNLKEWKLKIEEKRTKDDQPLSFTMKQNIYSAFRALLNFAVEYKYISYNPIKDIPNFKNAYKKKEKLNYYTTEEFKKYISASKKLAEAGDLYDWNFYVFFNIAFYTGMRKGEINALTWSDIEDNIIHITKSINQKLKGDDRITPPKNQSSVRDIMIPLPLLDILNEHKAKYQAIDNFTEDWFICGGPLCIRDTSIEKHNKEFAEKAKVKKIRIHDFRHSHASLLANEGINIQEIARRLGHAKVEITWNTYSHLYPREEERALKVLNKIKL